MHIFHKWKPYKVTYINTTDIRFPDKDSVESILWLKCSICKKVKKDWKVYDANWELSDFE